MLPTFRHHPVLAKLAPWVLMLALALVLSSCALVGAVIGQTWPAVVLAVTLALAACGQGSSGGSGSGTSQSGTAPDCKSLPAVLSLSTLNGCNGFQLLGVTNGDETGFSVSTAGDINGDGYPDFLIGAPHDDLGNDNYGEVYVVFGRPGGSSWPATLALSTLDGTDGFRLQGGNFGLQGGSFGDWAGTAVSAAGDINGDGRPDLIVGAPYAPGAGTRRGVVSVVFGQASGFAWPASLNLGSLDGTNGFQLGGAYNYEEAGTAVSAAGDINGDGRPDLLIGAPLAPGGGGTERGAVYVVFGQSSGFAWPSTLNLSTLNGSNGFRLNGVNNYEEAGTAVSAAGDLNGDGVADLLIGARHAAAGGTDRGAAYVVFGQSSGFAWPATLSLSTLAGSTGFQLQGGYNYAQAGFSVSAAGDINGDGLPDVLIGAPYAATGGGYFGAVYAVFGQSSGSSWPATLALNTLNSSTGFKIQGGSTFEGAGTSAGAAGDLNGDGTPDLVIGAPSAPAGGLRRGAVYVVFGQSSGFSWPATLSLSTLDGSNGLQLQGGNDVEGAGTAVSPAGDVNGDGIPDLLIGAPRDTVGGTAYGAAYVVFGSKK